jgi:hypothetical protein
VRIVGLPLAEPLPAPDATNFRYPHVWKVRTMVARRGAPKGPATASTAAPVPASAPKGAPRGPRPARPVGHQLHLPKPTASL